MDICKVLGGLNPVSPSEFKLSNESISSGNLPEPALFFTWYCEKAREIEKYTGSVEFSLKLLEFAIENLPSNARIAKRFILATRHSLSRYNSHIISLATKLEDNTITEDEKASILQTLRTIDLKTFETSNKKPAVSNDPIIPSISGEECEEVEENFEVGDWTFELEILNLILQNRLEEAFSLAQRSIFFPSALLDHYSSNPIEWFLQYCKTLQRECERFLETIKDDSVQIISPELCEDAWTRTVNEYLDTETSSFAEEQVLCLILTKCLMTQTFLEKKKKSNCFGDEEAYF